jgi:hypothetical protein
MCDYSLQTVKSRPAKVADKLVVKNFGLGTSGFCAEDDVDTAVCLLPGTEIAFDGPVRTSLPVASWLPAARQCIASPVAIFRQINKEFDRMHHDAVEFPDGTTVLLTHLVIGQCATVLQLPAAPKTEAEANEQKRLAVVG